MWVEQRTGLSIACAAPRMMMGREWWSAKDVADGCTQGAMGMQIQHPAQKTLFVPNVENTLVISDE